jgi:hypothetical protein
LFGEDRQLLVLGQARARRKDRELEKDTSLFGAFPNESAFTDPPPPLASHQRAGLFGQDCMKLAFLLIPTNVGDHVDYVPEKRLPL